MKQKALKNRIAGSIAGFLMAFCPALLVAHAVVAAHSGQVASSSAMVSGMDVNSHSAEASQTKDGDGIRVGPNPFTPNNNGFNDFVRFDFSGADATTGYTVQLFDMNGKRVRSLTTNGQSEIIWDGRDSGGSVLKPGIYLYIIERNDRVVRRGSVTLAL